ncbi:acidstable alpha-amylase [Pelomyxa schiedti]|nr:acidstable alpha-amylase [Pelomyxa schiedti]
MGFDAIWISPVVKNTPLGYHGYWAEDWYLPNPYFGNQDDLVNLVKKCHEKDIWVMIDVVANHVGPVDFNYTTIVPYNLPEHYHGCEGCDTNADTECWVYDYDDPYQLVNCRLFGLPDLNQSVPFVYDTLIDWISGLMASTGADGIRVDTAQYVDKSFWTNYLSAANVFQFGEVSDDDTEFVASFQPPFDSVLSYPMFYTLRDVFCSGSPMTKIHGQELDYGIYFQDKTVLGSFIDNHDQVRFLCCNSDVALYKNALAFVLMADGIPIIYYGSEQEFNGCGDPYDREPLWLSGYNTQSELYQYITTLVAERKAKQLWNSLYEESTIDESFYSFSRGDTFIALTNGGSAQAELSRTITSHPYQVGTVLCNVLDNEQCTKVVSCTESPSGCFGVSLENGLPQVLIPSE